MVWMKIQNFQGTRVAEEALEVFQTRSQHPAMSQDHEGKIFFLFLLAHHSEFNIRKLETINWHLHLTQLDSVVENLCFVFFIFVDQRSEKSFSICNLETILGSVLFFIEILLCLPCHEGGRETMKREEEKERMRLEDLKQSRQNQRCPNVERTRHQ